MKPIVILPLLAVSLISFRNCRREETAESMFPDGRTPMPAAVDAKEWVARLDTVVKDRGELNLEQLYAELPPQAEWPPLLARLSSAGDSARELKLRLFGEILKEDPKASATLRELVLAEKKSLSYSYSRDEAVGYLYRFSASPTEAGEWIEKNLPKAKDTGNSSSSEQDEIAQLLAKDQIDAAITALQAKITKEEDPEDKLDLIAKIVRITHLTQRQALHDQAFADMKSLAFRLDPNEIYNVYPVSSTLDELSRSDDWQSIGMLVKRYSSGKHDFISADQNKHEYHPYQLEISYQTEGGKAFLETLRQSNKYGYTDRASYLELLNSRVLKHRIGELAIRAYHEAGEAETARVILTYMLALNMGDDTYYKLALEYFPDRAAAMFEALRPYDPYEERPLIWLAEIALGKSDLVHAQTLIDEAIALDPSDGEQGKNTRMQAYDVLSRILRAKGETKKADFFADVTKSIRQGEEADDYLEAGLIEEAIRRYQAALGRFQDAYCLQSRLAKTLLKAGKVEEAMVHFQKAFELMPVSFGPVESHCFGCEQIFADPRVQEVALKTFQKQIGSTPQNPRTYYLLGMLYEEMNRPAEAVVSYRKAFELDPKYYNCAEKLTALLGKNPETIKEAQDMIPRLAAITPYPKFAGIFARRIDLRQTWVDAQTPLPSPLKLEPLPLPFTPGKAAKAYFTSYTSDEIKALDGWSTQEILSENRLVDWINDL